MRVVFVSLFDDFVGGGEHSLLDLLRHLPERWRPLLVTPRAGPLSAKAGQAGADVAHLPMPKLGLASLPALWRWCNWLRAKRPALLHANNSRAAVYAGVAGRLYGIPMIFHCRIVERDARLDWLIGRLANRIICNSRAVAERFSARHAKVEVIYNGVQMIGVEAAKKPWEAEAVILFAGRLSVEKQPDMAVRAFARLADELPGLHLALAGGVDPQNPGYSAMVMAEAEGLPCAQRIHWLGQREDMGAWYAIADLLVMPSRHEGFGRVIVEAMSCGVPVVAFAVGGIPEVMQAGIQGLLIQPGDETALVKALHNLLDHDQLRRSMGEAGRRRAADFSPEAHVEAMAKVFSSLVTGGANG